MEAFVEGRERTMRGRAGEEGVVEKTDVGDGGEVMVDDVDVSIDKMESAQDTLPKSLVG